MENVAIEIEGMSCEHCQKAVTDALKAVPGVLSVDVDLKAGVASVGYDEKKASLPQMRAAVIEAGYDVHS